MPQYEFFCHACKQAKGGSVHLGGQMGETMEQPERRSERRYPLRLPIYLLDAGLPEASDRHRSIMKPASDCSMRAAESKHPFYVAYDMPGLTVGISGDAAGKLYFIQAEQPHNAQPDVRAAIQSGPCPSQLRVAQSGRVTCFAPGTMGPGAHGGMPIPPMGAENPHGGMGLPPSGTPNPHAGKTAAPPPKKN